MTRISPLATPWQLGEVEVPNRMVMAPMSTNRVDRQGHVTQELIDYLARRAAGGCGMIIIESATVESRRGSTGQTLRMDDETCLDGCRALVSRIQDHGAIAVAQLWHAGPRAKIHGDIPLSPSGPVAGFPATRSLNLAEIEEIVCRFVDAGDRAARSGFNALEIHAAHGYLLHHFVDPQTNQRVDRYGGSVRRRFRILSEIRHGLRAAHPKLPVVLRVSLRPDEDFVAVASAIMTADFDAVDVRTGFSSMPTSVSGKPVSPSYCLPLVRKLRSHLNLPLLVGGRILTPEQAVRAIEHDHVAAILLGRPLLADPDWPKKALAAEQVVPCIYDCLPSCYSEFKSGKPLECVFYQKDA